jgi:hypothetical protein
MAATDYNAVVQQLYVSYFGRPADTYGLQNFTGQLATLDSAGALTTTAALALYVSQNPTSAVAKLVGSFASATESTNLYGTGTDILSISKFVNAIYNNVLHRDADTGGGTYWINEIMSGRVTKASAAVAITQGALDNTTAQGLIDAQVVKNTTAAAIDFTTSLDTIPKVNAFAGDVAAGQARDLLKTVTATTTPAAAHVAILAAIDVLVAPPTVNSLLTTGVDALVGTGANDVYSATNGTTAAATTWTALDTINGAGGTNKLVLVDTNGGVDLSLVGVTNIQNAVIQSTGGLANNAADLSTWTGLTSASLSLKSNALQTVNVAGTTALAVSNNVGVTTTGGSTVSVTAGGSFLTAAKALALATTNAQTAAAAVNAGAPSAAQQAAAFALAAGVSAADIAAVNAAVGAGGAFGAGTQPAVAAAIAAAVAAENAASTAAATATKVTISGNAITSATVIGGDVVSIGDNAKNTLTTVSLNGNTGVATLTSDTLTSVTLANLKTSTNIVNASAHAETVTVNKVTGGTITDAGATSFTLASTGTKSSAVSIAAGAATKVTINAAVDLATTDIAANLATSFAVTGAGKVTIAGLSAVGALISIDATANTGGTLVTTAIGNGVAFAGGTGNDTITLAANTKAITTGAGDDTVVIAGALGTGGTVDAGAGTDTLSGTSAAIVAAAAIGQATKFTNFETLKVTDALVNGTSYDVSGFAGVVNFTAGAGVASGTASAVNLGANANVTLSGNLITNNGALSVALKTDTAADVVNLTVNHSYLDNNDTTPDAVSVTATITANAIETINFKSTATNTQTADLIAGYKADVVTNTLVLTDDAIVNLKVTGDAGFVFNAAATQTKLTSIDASADTGLVTINGGAVLSTSAALTIKGSLTAANILTGGAGADVIVGGAKADTITGGNGGDTLTGNGGNDTFVFAAGSSTIGTGTSDTITDFVANTYGLGTNGAVTALGGTGVAAANLTGDLIKIAATGSVVTDTIKVFVATNASDASTFLANNHSNTGGAAIVSIALDSSSNNLYIDNTGDGVADFYIHLTGVTTITAAAFTLV